MDQEIQFENDAQEFAFLKSIKWNKLKAGQRKRLTELRSIFEPEDLPTIDQVIEEHKIKQEPIQIPTQEIPQDLPTEYIPAKLVEDFQNSPQVLLQRVWSEIKDGDDRGRLNSLISAHDLSSADMDGIYQRAFWLLQDGNSRHILKKVFNKL